MKKEMKKENFVALFEKHIVCIPAIQREYVQGYDEEQTNIVRSNFIDEIFDALSNESDLDIGIIYGYTQKEESSGKSIFFPVDGQQRITTLYVIYWCLSMMKTETEDDLLKDKILQYEVRNSTTRFFKELVNKEKIEFFKKCFSRKDSIYESLVSQEWFESQWLSDVTVLAVINVISEVYHKIIKKEDVKNFWDKALKNFSNIKFSLITFNNDDNNARRNSSLEFAKINARGKQLELFENVKSYLSIIEEKLGIQNSFAYNYDVKYIDLFYDFCKNKGDLEEITKNINNKTMILLINIYNLLREIERKGAEVKDELAYLSIIIDISKDCKEEDMDFWEKYISFLNNILQTFFNLNSLDELNSFSSEMIDYNQYKDTNKLVSQLLYYSYYYNNHKDYVSKEVMDKFDYVLSNLRYSDWKEYNINEIALFIDKISKYDDIIECFVKLKDANDLNIFSSEVLDDIKVRLKEQSIKAKIVKEKGLKYNYFNEWEERFSDIRSIYYLLYFSGYWDSENNNGNFEKLKRYLEVARELFNKNDINLRTIFALAVNYNSATEQMMDSDKINKGTNLLFINPNSKEYLEYNNCHHWKDVYYFIEDNFSEKDRLLRKFKLDYLKLAYDLCIMKKISGLCNSIFEEKYNNCWLKYAIKYAIQRSETEFFERKISFLDQKLYIQLKDEEKPKYLYDKLNFFAYLYLLDKKRDKFLCFEFNSYVYYLYTRNVRDTLIYDRCLEYHKEVENACRKIINPFELCIIWEEEVKKQWQTRDFFYYKYRLEMSCDKDSLIELDGDVISKISFDTSPDIKSKLSYDFKRYRDKIEVLVQYEKKIMKELDSKIALYHKSSSKECDKDKEIKDVREFILESYNCEASFDWGNINKYLSKKSKKVDISDCVLPSREFIS